MRLEDGQGCSCGEETDPNLVLHGAVRCMLRPRRLQEGDEDYVEHKVPPTIPKLQDTCAQCGEPREWHAAVLRYVAPDTKPPEESVFLICPRSTFTEYRH
jgi:hypothetical protein